MIFTKEEIEHKIKRYDDRPALESLYNKNNLIGVEIGTQHGFNAYNILTKYNIKTLYLIDPYDLYPEECNNGADVIPIEEANEIENQAHMLLSKFRDKIIWVKEKSGEAYSLIPDELDFVYVDGNHRYKVIKRDIELYYPKVKRNGIFSGHDYKRTEKGVVKAVNEFFGKGNFYQKIWDWWVIKE